MVAASTVRTDTVMIFFMMVTPSRVAIQIQENRWVGKSRTERVQESEQVTLWSL